MRSPGPVLQPAIRLCLVPVGAADALALASRNGMPLMIFPLGRVVTLLAFVGLAFAAAAAEPAIHEFALGNPKAKVTVIEYASLTCPHCAHFQATDFKQIKKNYIDTGKIRFLMRDFPLDGLAMAGAVVARCVAPDKGQKLAELLFENQESWASAQKPIEPLHELGKLAGISEADFDACLKNKPLVAALQEEQKQAAVKFKIDATPAFFIGDQDFQGNPGYDEMAAAIDRELKKAK